MNNVIICEGSTDGIFLQYYMEKVNNWHYSITPPQLKHRRANMTRNEWSHLMTRGPDNLTIMSAGTCSELMPALEKPLKSIMFSGVTPSVGAIDKIILLTDRDEINTEVSFLQSVTETLTQQGVTFAASISANQWVDCHMITRTGTAANFQLFAMIIPTAGLGALETFLLEAISQDSASRDSYDKSIIEKGNAFVDTIDPQARYLNRRRYITKAKFDVYFSIRTAADQFTERQNILKNVPWEKYTQIQAVFQCLSEL